jgi:hypothetical protein
VSLGLSVKQREAFLPRLDRDPARPSAPPAWRGRGVASMGRRDCLKRGDPVLPRWLEALTGVVRSLRRATGQNALIDRRKMA